MPSRHRDTNGHDGRDGVTTTAHRRALALLAAILALAAGVLALTSPAAGAKSGAKLAKAAAPPAADCQPFGATPCLLPFPNNAFTVKDSATSTGLRVNLPANAMPVNNKGIAVSPAEYDRNDGFSPGSAMIVHVPGLDNPKAFAKTHAVGLLNMAAEFSPGQPIVVIDQATGKRQLVYSELDSNSPTPADTNLLIMPGKELTEGHTYIVALRSLRNSAGKLLTAPSWFEKLRDSKPLPANEQSQKGRYQTIFTALQKAGISRKTLYEAWNFTVGSTKSLTSRLLSIRNNAFSQLGDTNLADNTVQGTAPVFSVTGTSSIDSGALTEIQGTYQVPCYLDTCGPTATTGFHYSTTHPGPASLPTQAAGNIATADFECILPMTATPVNRASMSLYGHGLLGSRDEVTDDWVEALATSHNMMFCATDWWGLASGDTVLAVESVVNLNEFPVLVDRLQQGVLNFLYLGRLMDNPAGFAANPAFQSGGTPVIDTSNLYYDGNSQGGIEGGLTTAVSPDFRRAVLGVTGIDYGNLLIQRSTDFTKFKNALEKAYPDPSMYPVITDLLQQLWDRGDPDGYAPQMTTNPLPDTPSHTVLEQIAYGDHQVSMWAGVAEARTIGAKVHEPALDPVRSRDANTLFYGVPAIPSYPYSGSAITIWDSGPGRTQPPPVGNIPPQDTPTNNDPHTDPRRTAAAQLQDYDFWTTGTVVDTCSGAPCHTDAYVP